MMIGAAEQLCTGSPSLARNAQQLPSTSLTDQRSIEYICWEVLLVRADLNLR